MKRALWLPRRRTNHFDARHGWRLKRQLGQRARSAQREARREKSERQNNLGLRHRLDSTSSLFRPHTLRLGSRSPDGGGRIHRYAESQLSTRMAELAGLRRSVFARKRQRRGRDAAASLSRVGSSAKLRKHARQIRTAVRANYAICDARRVLELLGRWPRPICSP